MNALATTSRIVLQLLLCAGTLPFYPFVLLFAARMFTPRFWSEASAFTAENWALFLIYPAAAIGIPALIVSIVAAPATILRKAWLTRAVVIGLVAGSLAAVALLSLTLPADLAQGDTQGRWTSAWQLGGPLVVALWNLARLWSATRRAGPAKSRAAES